jgi:hypothetical protein
MRGWPERVNPTFPLAEIEQVFYSWHQDQPGDRLHATVPIAATGWPI